MPARNVAPYADEAVASILGQTFTDFELVIRDDGSTDGTRDKLRRWAAADPRIRLFEGESQLGPAGSSNWVVAQARAPLIARMDADDIAMPDRLERQYRLLERSPDVVMTGSLGHVMREDGTIFRGPETWRILRRSAFAPFAHSTIMFRRAAFDRAGGYRAVCDYWEDLDFSLRVARIGPVAVVAAPLLASRLSPLSCRLKADRDRMEEALDTMYRCLAAASKGECYEALLHAPTDGRVAPMAFVALGSLRLWRGSRPQSLRRLLKRGRLGFDAETAGALAWAGCAAVSPALARRAITLGIAWKERRARPRVAPGETYPWRVGAAGDGAVPMAGQADEAAVAKPLLAPAA